MPEPSFDPWSRLKGLQPYSFSDWPGKISAVVFLSDCNLNCPTCHNWELAQNPEDLPLLSKEKVFNYLKEKSGWLEGIVVSGGEPTCRPGLDLILDWLKQLNLPIKLDTNGLKPKLVQELFQKELINCLAVDVKGPWEKYPELTGYKCTPEQARESLNQIFNLAQNFPEKFYFRCTKVPSLTPQDLEIVKSYLPSGQKLYLQEYVSPKRNQSPYPNLDNSKSKGGQDVHGRA